MIIVLSTGAHKLIEPVAKQTYFKIIQSICALNTTLASSFHVTFDSPISCNKLMNLKKIRHIYKCSEVKHSTASYGVEI